MSTQMLLRAIATAIAIANVLYPMSTQMLLRAIATAIANVLAITACGRNRNYRQKKSHRQNQH
jgi:hypothetical protein